MRQGAKKTPCIIDKAEHKIFFILDPNDNHLVGRFKRRKEELILHFESRFN